MDKIFYTSEEISKGIDGIPIISKTSLRNLRNNRKITYTKISGICVYKREWIEDYINSNIRPAKTTQEDN